jgi:hypothetical protein
MVSSTKDSSCSNLFFADYPSKPSYHKFHTLPPIQMDWQHPTHIRS